MTMSSTYFCLCVLGILITGLSSVSSYITCSFEHNFCDWSSVNSNFPWRRTAGSTLDTTSGPLHDHTTSYGYYAYIQSIDSKSDTSEAVLQSKTIYIGFPTDFTFWYYMNGGGIGGFTLRRRLTDGMELTLWEKQGRQGDKWNLAQIVLPPGIFQLQFKATSKYRYGGDIAIDDIVLQSEHKAIHPVTNPTLASTTTSSQTYTIHLQDSCSFEKGFCGWTSSKNGDQMWTRQIGENPTLHIIGAFNGIWYCYTMGGNTTTLGSQLLRYTGKIRFKFSYIMPSTSNSIRLGLAIIERVRPTLFTTKEIWHAQGSTPTWKTATVDLSSNDDSQLRFSASGGTVRSSIGLDDIELMGAPEPSTSNKDLLFSCSFESSFCGIKLEQSVKQDTNLVWKRSEKSGVHGHYLVYKERNCSNGDAARAVLPETYSDDQIVCLSFRYITAAKSVLGVLQKVGDSSGRYIWTDTSSTEGSWTEKSITVNIFNSTRFTFEAVCTGQVKWTAIDDVKIVKGACSSGIVTKQYRCSFDRSMCGFTDNTSIGLTKWSRGQDVKGPTHDHTTGLGRYLFLQSSTGTSLKQAQLISPVFNASSPMCILFSVQVFERSKVKVSVYLRGNDSSMSLFPVWMLSRDVRSWRQAEIPVSSSELALHQNKDYQVIIEGTEVGCCDGLIALDDFQISPGDCKVKSFCSSSSCQHGGSCIESLETFECLCPPEYTGKACEHFKLQRGSTVFQCDFEKGIDTCGFTQEPSIKADPNLKWSRAHGYLDDYSYYATYYEREGSKGSQAVITSPELPGGGTKCLSLRYVSQIAKALQIREKEGVPTAKSIWQGANTNGTWTEMYLTIIVMRSFRLSFEATYIDEPNMIAIDDVLITNGSCKSNSSRIDGFHCSFDYSMCGFTQSTNNRYTNWTIGSGSQGPSTDHTTGFGKYLYLQSSLATEHKRAQLISPIFPPTVEPLCILFSVQVFETSVTELYVSIQPVNTTTPVTPEWKLSRDTNGWRQAEVPIYQPDREYQVIIEGREHGCCSGVIALDDLEISSDACKEIAFCVSAACHNGGTCVGSLDDLECVCPRGYEGIYCQHTIMEDKSGTIYHCDFESGIDTCRFTQEPSIKSDPKLMWKQSASSVPNAHGYYSSFHESPGLKGNKAVLTSPELHNPVGEICLSFRYVSDEPNGLDILLKDGVSTSKRIWQSYTTDVWNEGYLDISPQETFRISFEAVCNGASNSVAIDDIIISNSSCKTRHSGHQYYYCSFDKSLCGFQKYSAFGYSNWSIGSGSNGPAQDHTSGNGRYLFLQSPKTAVRQKARMISPVIHQNGQPDCILFSLQMFGTSSSVISLSIMFANGSITALPIWRLSQNVGTTWHQAEIAIHELQDYKIIIEASEHGCCDGVIAVDDFKLTTNICKGIKYCSSTVCLNGGTCIESLDTFSCLCQSLYTGKNCENAITSTLVPTSVPTTPAVNKNVLFYCNFEHGMCGLIEDPSLKQDPFLKWRIQKGNYSDSYGSFLSYYEAGGRYGDEARVFTPSFYTGGEDSCLSFRYIAENADILRVQLQQGPAQARQVWSSSVTNNTWKRAYIGITGIDAYEVTFVAKHQRDEKKAAIDEINIQKGMCSNKEEIDHTLKCTFDNGMCGFEELIENEGSEGWSIGKGSSGPATDHTDGSGQYFYVQTNKTQMIRSVKLEWNHLQPSKALQCMLLSVQMFGSERGLLVIRITPSGKSALDEYPSWMLSNNTGRVWHQAEINIMETLFYKVDIIVQDYCCGVIAIDDFEIRHSECKDAPYCSSSPCLNGAKCVESLNTYVCICLGHFTGRRCETDLSICTSSTCLNGGTCSHDFDGFICQCTPQFTGYRCEQARSTPVASIPTVSTSTRMLPASKSTVHVNTLRSTTQRRTSSTRVTTRKTGTNSHPITIPTQNSTPTGGHVGHSREKKKSKLGLILGLSLSAVAVVAIALISVFLYKRRKHADNQDEGKSALVGKKFKGLPQRLFSRVNPVYEHPY